MISAGQSSYGEWWQSLLSLPRVADGALSAREAVDRLLSHRVLRRQAAAVATEVSLRCARASASLEPAGTDPDAVLAGALRAQAELPGLLPVWRTSPRQALARLHLVAAAGLVPPDDLGRPSPDGGAAAVARATELALSVGRASSAAVPAVVVAAVVEAELAGAFAVAGGVVARAAARLVLAERGLDPSLLVAVDVGHVEQGGYAEALAAYRSDDLSEWLVQAAAAVEGGARESLAICEALARG